MDKQTQEALKMAIEVFELEESTWWPHTKMSKAYNACKEALEQPAQEPVAWMRSETKRLIKEIPIVSDQKFFDDDISLIKKE